MRVGAREGIAPRRRRRSDRRRHGRTGVRGARGYYCARCLGRGQAVDRSFNRAPAPAVPRGGFGSKTGGGVNLTSGTFAVTDEYGEVEPQGTFTIRSHGRYAFVIWLEAWRRGDDRDGRRYVITVTADDTAGNTGIASTQVTVRHDHRRDPDFSQQGSSTKGLPRPWARRLRTRVTQRSGATPR